MISTKPLEEISIPAARRVRGSKGSDGAARGLKLGPMILALPHALVLLCFLVAPIAIIVIVSFWEFNGFSMTPAFSLENYKEIFTSTGYSSAYRNTFLFAGLVWFITLLMGFPIAYFLSFHVESTVWRTALFLLCTVPFLTSNIIRNISWIPFLGRNGVLNSTLMALRVIDQPSEVFLFSNFSVVLAMVHLNTMFMIVPIFNSMSRIDRSLIEAARDMGAGGGRILSEIIVPLAAPGIMIGSIFVIALVLGDFSTVRLMSGGQTSSVGLVIANQISTLQYPFAAANAVVLLVIVLIIVSILLKVVDIRKQL